MMVFRPIKMLVFVGIAFVAGIIYERQSVSEECQLIGGKMLNGFCER